MQAWCCVLQRVQCSNLTQRGRTTCAAKCIIYLAGQPWQFRCLILAEIFLKDNLRRTHKVQVCQPSDLKTNWTIHFFRYLLDLGNGSPLLPHTTIPHSRSVAGPSNLGSGIVETLQGPTPIHHSTVTLRPVRGSKRKPHGANHNCHLGHDAAIRPSHWLNWAAASETGKREA
jgi:hypothetical protein